MQLGRGSSIVKVSWVRLLFFPSVLVEPRAWTHHIRTSAACTVNLCVWPTDDYLGWSPTSVSQHLAVTVFGSQELSRLFRTFCAVPSYDVLPHTWCTVSPQTSPRRRGRSTTSKLPASPLHCTVEPLSMYEVESASRSRWRRVKCSPGALLVVLSLQTEDGHLSRIPSWSCAPKTGHRIDQQ